MNLILANHEDQEPLLVNWNNVCYVEPRGEDGEDLHARIHFNVTSGSGALSVDVDEDLDAIASLLETAGETVIQLDEEDDADVDERSD